MGLTSKHAMRSELLDRHGQRQFDEDVLIDGFRYKRTTKTRLLAGMNRI